MQETIQALWCRRTAKLAALLIFSRLDPAQTVSSKGKNNQIVGSNHGISLQINIGTAATAGAQQTGSDGNEKAAKLRYGVPENITIAFGGSTFTFPSAYFSKPQKISLPVSIGGASPMSLQLRGGFPFVDAQIRDAQGGLRAEVKDNQVTIKPNEWDVNFSEAAVEMVNQQGQPVFQLIRKRPDFIAINERFEHAGAVWDASANVPLFLYPAWKYPGRYTANPTPVTEDLSELTDEKLKTLNQEYVRQLNELGNLYKEEEDALHDRVNRDHSLIHSQLHMQEDDKYTRLFRQRSVLEFSVEQEMEKRVASRAGAINMPEKPRYLQDRMISGPDSFSVIASYLVSLERLF